MVELIAPPHQVADNPNQITPNGTADTAIVHFNDFFIASMTNWLSMPIHRTH
jgi:hypothetical protein